MRRKFAPRGFGIRPFGMGVGMGRAVLFVGLATGTFLGVRRFLARD